jgi:phosphohistidine phosphatase
MIHLIRHADAVSDEANPVRPLSPKGCDQVARVCAVLRRVPGFKPSEIWHSPLARSRETAQLLAEGLALSSPLVLTPGLEPEDNPSKMAALLDARTDDVVVVGHEPHLGVLATLLVHGPDRPGVIYPFSKAGVLALTRDGKRWRSEWIVRSP